MFEKAEQIAEKAHRGQKDKGGHPYILHPKRVAERCETEEEKITAILHDVLEDSEYTLDDLRKEGFAEDILVALTYLTHRAGEGYTEYIERICENPLAVRVKHADLLDNMDISRISHPTEKDFARLEKYRKAKGRIEAELGLWTKERYEIFRQELLSQAEEEYRKFNEKLLCSDLPVLGIRVPVLRKIAVKIAKENGVGFLQICGEGTFEERLLYGLVAAALPVSCEEFLPYCDYYTEHLVENWSHCDTFCVSVKKIIKGHERDFFAYIEKYLKSENPWAVRTGLVLMLNCYLDKEYLKKVLERTDRISSEHYYVRMGQAWLLATAWAKDREQMLSYIKSSHLDDWTWNKFIQKCCESYRVLAEDKVFLRGLKR